MTEHRPAEDALQVPPPRADQARNDPDATDRDFQATAAESRDQNAERQWQGRTRDDLAQEDQARAGQAWEGGHEERHQPMMDADAGRQQEDTRYHDPYETQAPDDVLAGHRGETARPEAAGQGAGTAEPERTQPATAGPAGPGSAAGQDIRREGAEPGGFLLDQDPEQVRIRWREVQAYFVDDPRESVDRADALVEELLATLTSRAAQLRDRCKNAGGGDTEVLRQALREYRLMVDQLLLTLTPAER
ncbi:hypothetical protein [Nonomuraea sp. NPDC003804]|uniref:hypothetical protein n=1 Tax=Nonomuraea sp. NPDC003804 TaxID=3154547 RepID=UPI0033B36BF3